MHDWSCGLVGNIIYVDTKKKKRKRKKSEKSLWSSLIKFQKSVENHTEKKQLLVGSWDFKVGYCFGHIVDAMGVVSTTSGLVTSFVCFSAFPPHSSNNFLTSTSSLLQLELVLIVYWTNIKSICQS